MLVGQNTQLICLFHMHCERTGSGPSASLAVLSRWGLLSSSRNKQIGAVFCHQPEDLVIPHIGPEFIAALRDKVLLDEVTLSLAVP